MNFVSCAVSQVFGLQRKLVTSSGKNAETRVGSYGSCKGTKCIVSPSFVAV